MCWETSISLRIALLLCLCVKGLSTKLACNEVSNKQNVFKDYITRIPKVSHMSVKSTKLPVQMKDGS